jgi:hypothetical protein
VFIIVIETNGLYDKIPTMFTLLVPALARFELSKLGFICQLLYHCEATPGHVPCHIPG